MATINLKGINKPIIVDDEQAKKLQNDWLTHSLPPVVKVGSAVIDAKQIKSIELEADHKIKQQTNFIDMNDSSFVEEVKKFEKEFFAFEEKYPQLKVNPYSELKWFEQLEAIKLHKTKVMNYKVLNVKLYHKLQRLWSGLQLLRQKRKLLNKLNI